MAAGPVLALCEVVAVVSWKSLGWAPRSRGAHLCPLTPLIAWVPVALSSADSVCWGPFALKVVLSAQGCFPSSDSTRLSPSLPSPSSLEPESGQPLTFRDSRGSPVCTFLLLVAEGEGKNFLTLRAVFSLTDSWLRSRHTDQSSSLKRVMGRGLLIGIWVMLSSSVLMLTPPL